MTSFFVLINGFEARVRARVRVQSLTRVSEQLGNVTISLPAALIIIAASCVTEGDITRERPGELVAVHHHDHDRDRERPGQLVVSVVYMMVMIASDRANLCDDREGPGQFV